MALCRPLSRNITMKVPRITLASQGRLSTQLPPFSRRTLIIATPVVRNPPAPQSGAALVATFHASAPGRKGLMPESSEPPPPNNEVPPDPGLILEATPMGEEQFNVKATSYLEVVALRVEAIQAKGANLEVELSTDTLNLNRPGFGDFALAKKPDTKQLLFSSPVSGQRVFHWVISGGGMNQKQDTDHHGNLDGRGSGVGFWIDLKDGTSLSAVLDEELGLGMVDNFK